MTDGQAANPSAIVNSFNGGVRSELAKLADGMGWLVVDTLS